MTTSLHPSSNQYDSSDMKTLLTCFMLCLCTTIQALTINPGDCFLDEGTGVLYTIREVRMGIYVYMTDEQEDNYISLTKVDGKEGAYTLEPSRQADEPPIPNAKFGWPVKYVMENDRKVLAFCDPQGTIIYSLRGVPNLGEDDTLPPMFLLGTNHGLMQMVYWVDTAEPQYTSEYADEYENMHQEWAFQEKLRSYASLYTNLIVNGDQTLDVEYVDEILFNPDGEKIFPGELHGRPQIPSPGPRFLLTGQPTLPDDERPGVVLVTDSYLTNHKPMSIKPADENGSQPLPATVIEQMENKYGMKVERSAKTCIIGDRYTYGVLQFEGEYKNAGVKADPDTKSALALEIITDGDNIYSYPVVGWFYPSEGPTWHADDGGEYFPGSIVAAFEGSQGPEFYFVHWAPESATTGQFTLTNGQIDCQEYAMYHSLIDENLPVWKKDIEEMKRLYVADDPGENKNVELTKWAHVFIDDEGEQIWISDEAQENGAFFSRENEELILVATTRRNLTPSFPQSKDGNNYLMLSGPAGGPSYYYEIYTWNNGKVIEEFNAMEIYGELDGCALNGIDYDVEQGKKYMKAIPEATEPYIFWNAIDNNE